jgi:hypothetical protein
LERKQNHEEASARIGRQTQAASSCAETGGRRSLCARAENGSGRALSERKSWARERMPDRELKVGHGTRLSSALSLQRGKQFLAARKTWTGEAGTRNQIWRQKNRVEITSRTAAPSETKSQATNRDRERNEPEATIENKPYERPKLALEPTAVNTCYR